MTSDAQPGRTGTRLNQIWKTMKSRCYNRNRDSYPFYGGRGIYVCPQWHSFIGFLDWALATDYSDEKEIDRIDTDGPYSPENCRWVLPFINRSRKELDRRGDYLRTLSGKLTRELVEQAEQREQGYKIADGGGLNLYVSGGGRKSWRYRYRFDGVEKTLVIGKYPRLGLWEAREAHAIAVAQVKRGLDPATIKQKNRRRRDIERAKASGNAGVA